MIFCAYLPDSGGRCIRRCFNFLTKNVTEYDRQFMQRSVTTSKKKWNQIKSRKKHTNLSPIVRLLCNLSSNGSVVYTFVQALFITSIHTNRHSIFIGTSDSDEGHCYSYKISGIKVLPLHWTMTAFIITHREMMQLLHLELFCLLVPSFM